VVLTHKHRTNGEEKPEGTDAGGFLGVHRAYWMRHHAKSVPRPSNETVIHVPIPRPDRVVLGVLEHLIPNHDESALRVPDTPSRSQGRQHREPSVRQPAKKWHRLANVGVGQPVTFDHVSL
jgi:hypothetical protein